MGDSSTPLRDLLNRSGIPFQLAVEAAIRSVGLKHGIEDVRSEVPYSDGFLDIVARKARILFVFECKRADDKPWVFLLPEAEQTNQTRCRVEWFNGRAPIPKQSQPGHSRVFCGEWNMGEPSPESGFCVVPKGSPVQSLEAVCRELLAGAHDLLAREEIAREEFATVIPVLITTAHLHTCALEPSDIALDTGELAPGQGGFETTTFVRFRKSLVTARSNSYESAPMDLRHWTADRERTVFVLNPSALGRFFAGFRSFHCGDGFHGTPMEFLNPPQLAE
jgi:hypothetical protein